MSGHARQLALGARRKRKRKERDAEPSAAVAEASDSAPAPANNRLLAGYLAHEFLTRGTLFGRKLDPGRAEPVQTPNPAWSESTGKTVQPGAADVARLMRADGVHVEGVVNPAQLKRWLQM